MITYLETCAVSLIFPFPIFDINTETNVFTSIAFMNNSNTTQIGETKRFNTTNMNLLTF